MRKRKSKRKFKWKRKRTSKKEQRKLKEVKRNRIEGDKREKRLNVFVLFLFYFCSILLSCFCPVSCLFFSPISPAHILCIDSMAVVPTQPLLRASNITLVSTLCIIVYYSVL